MTHNNFETKCKEKLRQYVPAVAEVAELGVAAIYPVVHSLALYYSMVAVGSLLPALSQLLPFLYDLLETAALMPVGDPHLCKH